TGCKLAVVDASGRYIGSGLMHLETPAGKAAAAPVLAELVKKGGIRAVAGGNGTAGRETEAFVREALRHVEIDVPVGMVGEGGGRGGGVRGCRAPGTPPARSSRSWTSPCAARSRSRAACRIRWPSW